MIVIVLQNELAKLFRVRGPVECVWDELNVYLLVMWKGLGNSFQKIYDIGWSTSIVNVHTHHQTHTRDLRKPPHLTLS